MAAGSGGPSNDRVETLLGRLMGNTPKKLESVFNVIGFSRKTPKRKSAKSFSKHLNLKTSFKFLQGIFKTSSNFATFCNNKTIEKSLGFCCFWGCWLMVAGDPLEHPWVLSWQGLAAVVSQQALALKVGRLVRLTSCVGMIQHDPSNMIYQIWSIKSFKYIQMMKWWNDDFESFILASELCTERLLRLGVGATTTRPSSHLLTWNPFSHFLISGFLVENEWEQTIH